MKLSVVALLVLAACSSSHHESDLSNIVTNVPSSPDPQDGSIMSPDAVVVSGSDGGIDSSPPITTETDSGCGGPTAPKCVEGKKCLIDRDCEIACNYALRCVGSLSCKPHFGGDTCGAGESDLGHESCCRSLPVPGFVDDNHPGKTVYLDKYEITAGRMRAFIVSVTQQMGKPNVKGWIAANKPIVWDDAWSKFLPTNVSGDMVTINRLLLGDPRHDGEVNPGPGVIVPPTTDQSVDLGANSQFGAQVYADVHGNNCGLFPGAYGFPTFYYPADILTHNNEIPRDPSLKDVLDSKSINCVTNVMLAAFCVWDGGQLATAEVLDYVTASPGFPDSVSGCGSQYDNHGELLGNIFTHTTQSGGRCAPVIELNATFDAGDNLPLPGSPLNTHNYNYPDLGGSASDKVWQIAAPGRVTRDTVRINPNDEPWMDLGGNLSESVLVASTKLFGLRQRGIGYGSSRSDLNVTLMPGETILRVQRPEVKSGLTGGRCMRFK